VSFLDRQSRVLDWSDAGTGKTPVHVTAFAKYRKKRGSGKALVLCPKSLIKSAWGNDFARFAPHLKVSLAYADNRDEAFAVDADVYVTNIDALVWLAKKPPSFFKDFDYLIIDESTSIKHPTSQRSKAIAKIRKYFTYRRLLSGTPATNGITNLWHQAYVCDDGKRLGDSFFKFRAATCTPEQVGQNAHAIRWNDKPGIEVVVGALLQDITIRHKFEDCVDIPPNYKHAVEYELPAKHRKYYDTMERDSFLAMKNRKTVTAINAAVLYGKLLQCASGASYDDSGEDYTLLDTGRYELVGALLEERRHSVVFFNWSHQRDEMIKIAQAEKWPYALIDGTVTKKGAREQIVADYQAGRYKVLFAHPQSAGHGLTLTRGTTTIFASPTANLEFYLQGLKRIYRISQTEKTETIVVVAKDTIDEQAWASCQQKDAKQYDLLEYMEGRKNWDKRRAA